MQFAINLYEEIEGVNILDTGIVDVDNDDVQSVIDLALEIVYRRQEKLPIEDFMGLLDDVLGKYM